MITKGQQLKYRNRRKRTVLGVEKEADLQTFTNDYLETMGVRYIRIPDKIFRWINSQAPIGIRIWFNHTFAGIPDNLCLLDNGRYLCIELKTR